MSPRLVGHAPQQPHVHLPVHRIELHERRFLQRHELLEGVVGPSEDHGLQLRALGALDERADGGQEAQPAAAPQREERAAGQRRAEEGRPEAQRGGTRLDWKGLEERSCKSFSS